MKKFLKFAVLLLIIPAFVFTSCKDDNDDDALEDSFVILKEYLIEQDIDLDHIIKYNDGTSDIKFVAGAPAEASGVTEFIGKYYIMDIREGADYATGHIEGAKSVTFANILTEAENAGSKPILVVCYTGQTACYATALLRLYGYHNAQALKWGMSGWTTSVGSWNSNIGDVAKDHANWTYNAAPTNVTYNAPELSSLLSVGEDLLKARVEQVVAEGFKGVSASDVVDSPSDYFINNYFSEADYLGFGHVNGAVRINPLLLTDGSMLNIDPSKQVVTYCYTGQTSAVITAFLRVIGYDAYSLKFGMNGLYNTNSAWTTNQWSSTVAKDYPVVTE